MSSPTIKDVYEIVYRIEDKFDSKLNKIEREITSKILNIETRTDSLEIWKSNITGKIAILASFFGIISGVVVSIITAEILKRL